MRRVYEKLRLKFEYLKIVEIFSDKNGVLISSMPDSRQAERFLFTFTLWVNSFPIPFDWFIDFFQIKKQTMTNDNYDWSDN